MNRASVVSYRIAELLGQHTPQLEKTELETFVRSFLQRRDFFLDLTHRYGAPLYVLEEAVLLERAARFRTAFESILPEIKPFYAIKSNNHPAVASSLVRAGMGLDVSSGEELNIALACNAERILFSGPGKTEMELRSAVEHSDRVTVLLDSYLELERLEQAAAEQNKVVRAGVRLTTDEFGIWRKFGIPLRLLSRFFSKAAHHQHIRLCGLQFHLSWNLTPENHALFLARLGATLRTLDHAHLSAIEFVDIGGGFWPEQGEWLQAAATPAGRIRGELYPHARPSMAHYRMKAATIEDFAEHIGRAIKTQLWPEIKCQVYTEPGRWLCNDAMQILLRVSDRKSHDLVITDGGINAVGWERYETDYCPIINLSHPGIEEQECLVAGSLCTPHDIWGYSYFGDDIRPGDVLLIPQQGAYTYSLRQNFIKPLPEVVVVTSQDGAMPQDSIYRAACSDQ
jgi:diaminopimelate decarboxylase